MIEIASVVIAALSALLAYFAARESRRSSQSAAEAALRIAKAQQELYVPEVRLQYYSEVRQWADSALDALCELMGICYLDPTGTRFGFREEQVAILSRLSSLIDRGRFFLPNTRRDKVGQHKAPAFQGFRHPALDCLVYSYNEGLAINYEDGSGNREKAKVIEKNRRKFVGIVQAVIETDDWVDLMESHKAEQGGADQPAIAVNSEVERKDESKPESEGRSQ